MMIRKELTREKVLQKARFYCSYQFRSPGEVKKKLYSYALKKNDVEELLAQLIQENYLNEELFAVAFARGKFRMKQWGKVKIKYELTLKKVSKYCIDKGLKEINEEEYQQTLQKLSVERWQSLKNEKNIYIKKRKLQYYLLQKGFEHELIRNIVSIA